LKLNIQPRHIPGFNARDVLFYRITSTKKTTHATCSVGIIRSQRLRETNQKTKRNEDKKMRKAKRTFINAPKVNTKANKMDFTHEGFIVVHEKKTIYVFDSIEAEIRKGNEDVLNKALEIFDMYPDYTAATLHMMFAG
jgi:hypothetical protein